MIDTFWRCADTRVKICQSPCHKYERVRVVRGIDGKKRKLRFHENSSNHPKDFTSLFLGQNSFLVFHLAFISYEKLFEYTAMHLATWKPDFTGGCKQRVNCYQIARHVSPDTIQTSPNIRFLGGFIFEKYLSITFLDVVVQNRYIYTLLVNIF